MHSYTYLNSMNWGPGFSLALVPVFAIVIIWSLVWKGIALWRSARNGHTAWFVVLLIVNTVGILEIIYILTAGKKHLPPSSPAA